MVRWIVRTVIFVSFMMLLCGIASKNVNAKATNTANTAKVIALKRKGKKINWHSYLPSRYRKKYRVMQGSATDGKFLYMIYVPNKGNKCIILKVNARTNRKVKVSQPILLYHGNDVVYNPDTRLLYVTYNDDKHPFSITIVDPKTLKIRGRRTIKIPGTLEGMTKKQYKDLKGLAAITYNSLKKQYAMRVSMHNDFIIFDDKFKPLRYVHARKTLDIRYQSIDSDDEYIYSCMDNAGHYNMVLVYDWDGNLRKRIRIPLKYEIESIYHLGKKFYVSFYDGHYERVRGRRTYVRSSYTYRIQLPSTLTKANSQLP